MKINIVRLKNTTSEKRHLKLVYYIKPVLGEDETKTDGYIDINLQNNIIYAKNIYGDNLSKNVYVSSSEEILSYTGNNISFVGNRDLSNPIRTRKSRTKSRKFFRNEKLYSIRNWNRTRTI